MVYRVGVLTVELSQLKVTSPTYVRKGQVSNLCMTRFNQELSITETSNNHKPFCVSRRRQDELLSESFKSLPLQKTQHKGNDKCAKDQLV